jgi:hypothetical protein
MFLISICCPDEKTYSPLFNSTVRRSSDRVYRGLTLGTTTRKHGYRTNSISDVDSMSSLDITLEELDQGS